MRNTLFFACLLTGAALSAQSITGGLQTGLSLPAGDLTEVPYESSENSQSPLGF